MSDTLAARLRLIGVLIALGVGWGATQPLGKIAVSSGYQPFVLIFWQAAIGTVVLGAISLMRGRGLVLRRGPLMFAAVVALTGTLIPGMTFYISIGRLPSGIMSILISTVPMMSFPIAVALGMDRFSGLRLMGLMLGLVGVGLIAAPGAGVYAAGMVAFLPLAMIGPLFYAIESNFVARVGTFGMDAIQAMFMASGVAMVLSLPVVLLSGQWIDPTVSFGRPEAALVISSVIHGLCYAGYVWLATRAGAVFASQTGYLVTGAGVLWAMALLGERLSLMAVVALVVILCGVALVQPRHTQAAAV